MNIKQAKEEIKNAVRSYLMRDEFGNLVIPIERQRPVFLLGPPGIGKTAIMQQIAEELNIGLVSYSMTHHTRQSAIGLPFIAQKEYGGETCSVSEYTMSEIISSVYDLMEETGQKEGILFLDEINCVSETLAPAMLQFLQFKIFGRHRVPDGWIVVTAGNPPEYNKSVREFDIVTWDRLKRMEIEPDFEAWREYASKRSIHGAILTYLDLKKERFYTVETTVDGKNFVTARGWEDLSDMIRLYESQKIQVTQTLIAQYLQKPAAAREFSIYYDLYNKYRSSYQIPDILAGKVEDRVCDMAKKAQIDERISLVGLLMDAINADMRAVVQKGGGYTAPAGTNAHELDALGRIFSHLVTIKKKLTAGGNKPSEAGVLLAEVTRGEREELKKRAKSGALGIDERYAINYTVQYFESLISELTKHGDTVRTNAEAADYITEAFNKKLKPDCVKEKEAVQDRVKNLFTFVERVFGADEREMVLLVTELTRRAYCAKFIQRYGCEAYFRHNKELILVDRREEYEEEIRRMEDLLNL